MARRRTPDQAKMRTREHIVADLAVNHFERQALLAKFAIERTTKDYGVDVRLLTFDSQGLLEAGILQIQVKGTDHIKFVQNQTAVTWRVLRSDLQTWLFEMYPVILVVYDTHADRAYWLHVQGYFASLPGFDLFSMGDSITVRIPVGQVLNPAAVSHFAELRDQAGAAHH